MPLGPWIRRGTMCETKHWRYTGNVMGGLGRCWQDLLFDSAEGGAKEEKCLVSLHVRSKNGSKSHLSLLFHASRQ